MNNRRLFRKLDPQDPAAIGLRSAINRRSFLGRGLSVGAGLLGAAALDMRNAPTVQALGEPNPPAKVDAQGLSDSAVQVLWTAVTGANSYDVYRDGTVVASQAATLYMDVSLTSSTIYTYQVAAIVAGVASTLSSAVTVQTQAPRDTTPPTQPGAIAVSGLASSSATLKWTKSTDDTDIVGYRMLRGSPGAPVTQLVQIGTTDAINSYTATNLRAGTGYQFAVIAVDPDGNLSAPRTVTFTTTTSSDTTIPVGPSSGSATATPFSATRIDLVWGASSAADLAGYRIYRDGQVVGEVYLPMRRYFSDNGLLPGSTHTYQVSAIDSAGNESVKTTSRTATTLANGVVKIVRGPYLQRTGTDSTIVAWWTNIPAASQVSYGVGSLTYQVRDEVPKTRHAMLVAGLTLGTTYKYQVVSGAVSSAESTFVTAAAAGSTFSFAAIGDYGGGGLDETRNADLIATAGTQFVQTLGDNVYPDAQDPDFATTYFDWDHRFYKPFGAVMSKQPIFAANGNKDHYGDGAAWQIFWMANNARWYSYDWGDAHILVLDTECPYAPGTPQYQFAEADLIANQSRRWRIAVVHRPPYSSATANSSSGGVVADLTPLFEQKNVHLVLSGNTHNYERSYPLLGGLAQSTGGVTYIVSGAGGNGLNAFTISQPSWSAFRAATYQHLKVTVSPEALVVASISADTGGILDTVTISNVAHSPVAITGTVTNASTGTALVGATVTYDGGSTATDGFGAYSFADVPAGTYTVTVGATGFVGQSRTVTVGNTSVQEDFALVPVAVPVNVFADTFESGNLAAWTSAAGLTVQGATVHAGAYASQGNTSNGGTFAKKTLPSTYPDAYARIYFNIVSMSSQVNLLRLRTAADTSIAYLYVNTAGKLVLRNDFSASTITSTAAVASGWHALELHAVINGAAGRTEVWLDGSKIATLSITTNLGSNPIGRVQIGETQTGRVYNVVFDDIVFDTQPIGL